MNYELIPLKVFGDERGKLHKTQELIVSTIKIICQLFPDDGKTR